MSKKYTDAVKLFNFERESAILKCPDVKKFHKFVNGRLGSSKKSLPLCLEKDGIVYDNDSDCARVLSEQHARVFIQDDGNVPLADVINVPVMNDLLIIRVHVVNTIKSMKPNVTAGPDKIPGNFLQKFPSFLSVPLQTIFQASLTEGVLPIAWKSAVVTPIFKGKGHSRKDPAAFRPVSLNCIGCKLMESILKDYCAPF